jgi:hypothetical protein
MKTTQFCSACAAPLAPDAPAGLCPACLLKSDAPTQTVTEASLSGATARVNLPVPGEMFGGYRIARLLGSGGMGAVYEADQVETGRRVALKVLGHALDSPASRERFLREGRLAASINHPNSVYVYGTEEIGGTPAIAMELVGGGTLQDRVKQHGPMPCGEAVDAVLQIIAGLEAAQAIGILHRDIKPSNCFVETDGTVKVGDFGLSIATTGRAETHLTVAGSILGTPAFASPEQLRGAELNTRSDLYSVGVTLYYLLTGRTPFEADNLVKLLSRVLEEPPPSPRKFRGDVPQGLARVVLRCLAKQPGERFKDYAELRRALFPYASAAPTPATLGLRFAAGCIDGCLLVSLLVLSERVAKHFMAKSVLGAGSDVAEDLFYSVVWLLYYGVTEGLWGASAAKALLGLRVVGANGQVPGLRRGALRALISEVLPSFPGMILSGLIAMRITSAEGWLWPRVILGCILSALLFVTMRRRNGFAAIHDLLTRTRVVEKSAYQARPGLPARAEVEPSTEGSSPIGPYHRLETLGETPEGKWLLAYDTRLLRKLWLRVVPASTPPVPAPLRSLRRVGRLRWLNSRRVADGQEPSWDAYEAVAGQPLVGLCEQPQPWAVVRYWLLDLAEELALAVKESTLPAVLTLDRVWISDSGRAKLLDFPAPGTQSEPPASAGAPATPPPLPAPGTASVQRFLSEVATASLGGRDSARAEAPIGEHKSFRRTSTNDSRSALAAGQPRKTVAPAPIYARRFLDQLVSLGSPDEIAQTLKRLLPRAATVTRARRLAIIAATAAFPAVEGVFIFVNWLVNRDLGHQRMEWSVVAVCVTMTGLLAVLAALLFRGGLVLRAAGVAVVRGNGAQASRWLLFCRSFVAWTPLVFLTWLSASIFMDVGIKPAILTAAAAFALVLSSALLPNRSLPDRLARTWLVPR